MLERLGAPVGSLGTAYLEAPTLYMCLACAEQVSPASGGMFLTQATARQLPY